MTRLLALFTVAIAAILGAVVAQPYPEKGDAWRIRLVVLSPEGSELNGAYLRENNEKPGYYLACSKDHSTTNLGHDFVTLRSEWGEDHKTIWNTAMDKCLKDDVSEVSTYGWTFVDPSAGCPKWILEDPSEGKGRVYLSRETEGALEFNAHGPVHAESADGYTITHCGSEQGCYGHPVRLVVEHEQTG